MSSRLIFYDLPCRGTPACWSLNPWKARAALNFKRVPYETEWVEYPDVAPKFKGFGIPPNSPDLNPNAQYSIPAARFPDGSYVMDSLAIAHKLEQLQPEPTLHLDNDYATRAQTAVNNTTKFLGPIALPRVPELLLNPASQGYFNETREKRFGMPLTELAKSEKAGEQAWEGAKPGLEELKALLNEKSDGPYVQGQEVSFADFVLAGLWTFAEKLDKEGDLYGRLIAFDESFQKHHEATKKWFERET